MTASLEKELLSWSGEIMGSRTGVLSVGSRTGVLSDGFTSRNFAQTVGKDSVRGYTVRLSWKTPVTSDIIGAEAFLV
ncbi:MAG: hypothetical protein ACYC9S_08405 [Leptospirales bacterium]